MNKFVLRIAVVGAAVLFAPAFVTAQTSPNRERRKSNVLATRTHVDIAARR